MCPFRIAVSKGETREEKIKDQLWDYCVINRTPFISEILVTGNEITGWYAPI